MVARLRPLGARANSHNRVLSPSCFLMHILQKDGTISILPFVKYCLPRGVISVYSRRILMSVTRERFEQGLTYDEYKAQMTRNQERFVANEEQLALDPADLAVFKNLPQPLNVLVIAEDWCGDVINNLPI